MNKNQPCFFHWKHAYGWWVCERFLQAPCTCSSGDGGGAETGMGGVSTQEVDSPPQETQPESRRAAGRWGSCITKLIANVCFNRLSVCKCVCVCVFADICSTCVCMERCWWSCMSPGAPVLRHTPARAGTHSNISTCKYLTLLITHIHTNTLTNALSLSLLCRMCRRWMSVCLRCSVEPHSLSSLSLTHSSLSQEAHTPSCCSYRYTCIHPSCLMLHPSS